MSSIEKAKMCKLGQYKIVIKQRRVYDKGITWML